MRLSWLSPTVSTLIAVVVGGAVSLSSTFLQMRSGKWDRIEQRRERQLIEDWLHARGIMVFLDSVLAVHGPEGLLDSALVARDFAEKPHRILFGGHQITFADLADQKAWLKYLDDAEGVFLTLDFNGEKCFREASKTGGRWRYISSVRCTAHSRLIDLSHSSDWALRMSSDSVEPLFATTSQPVQAIAESLMWSCNMAHWKACEEMARRIESRLGASVPSALAP